MFNIPTSSRIVCALVRPSGGSLAISTPQGFPFYCSSTLDQIIGQLGVSESLVRKNNDIYRCNVRTVADYWDARQINMTRIPFPEALVWLGCPPWLRFDYCRIGGTNPLIHGLVCLKSEGEALLRDYLDKAMV